MSANQLQNTASPYLLLHKDNPVHWRLWNAETLAEAKAAGKPIFLSIGYTGCHWCHVMNEESFSDPAIAALLNDNFIPVIADREERPDLDQLYQAASNIMGLQGGWPLNIFLNPEGEPYFVVSYIPKEERLGQPAFKNVLTDTIALWRDRPEQVTQNATNIRAQLENLFERDMRAGPEAIQLDAASLRTAQRFDIFFGGLTGAPKFPSPTVLDVMWRAFLRTGAAQYSQLLFATLDHMLFGGLYDHVGGGFFRYVNDERWLVPHFEKMLYDNALLIDVLTGVWQYNRSDLCRQRVEETINWMLREMKLPGGGFAAGLNPDSEGEEGKYYLWSEPEIDAALAGTFSAKFKSVYEVTRDGNHAGRNILRRIGTGQPTTDADEALMARQRALLLAARGKRVRPARDDKLLADWNGLAIAALANAGAVFERPDWIAEAIATFDHIVATLGDGETLYHSAVGGQRGAQGFAEDYADMARAALQLYEVTGDKRFIDPAKTWFLTLDKHFWDEARGGYFVASDQADPLLIRIRMVHDQPAPSANGVMLGVLSRLVLLTGDKLAAVRAGQLLRSFAAEVPRAFLSMGAFLNGAEAYSTALQVVVFGPKNSAKTQELIRTVWGKALPNRMLIHVEPGDTLPEGHPAAGQGMQSGQATAYICQGLVCSTPIQSAVTLSQVLTLPPQQRKVAANA